MEALIALVVIAVLAGPVLAIMALVAVRRLESSPNPGLSQIRDLTARVFALERQLRELAVAQQTASATTRPEPAGVSSTETRAQIAPLATPQPPTTKPVPASPAPPPPPISHSAPSPLPLLQPISSPDRTNAPDLENLIGGRWLNRIGIVAMLIAVSYFLKLAFDNNWIGPTGRVAIGILLGAFMLPWSHWLLSRGYSYFSEGIAALGEATLFLSVWAGCQYYTLYSRSEEHTSELQSRFGISY